MQEYENKQVPTEEQQIKQVQQAEGTQEAPYHEGTEQGVPTGEQQQHIAEENAEINARLHEEVTTDTDEKE